DRDGQVAFTESGGVKINPAYFRRLDQRMDAIEAAGLVAAPVLIWANKKDDPGNRLPEADVVRLLKYQTARYGAHPVVWIMAGDNSYKDRAGERWRRIGELAFFEDRKSIVMTHPTGHNWPWDEWKKATWLDVLTYQSGHGDNDDAWRCTHSGPPAPAWRRARKGAAVASRPIITPEPPYEDHNGYQSRKPHPAYNVRRAVYWSLMSTPIAGVTYGAHGVWSWQTEPGQEPRDHAGTG